MTDGEPSHLSAMARKNGRFQPLAVPIRQDDSSAERGMEVHSSARLLSLEKKVAERSAFPQKSLLYAVLPLHPPITKGSRCAKKAVTRGYLEQAEISAVFANERKISAVFANECAKRGALKPKAALTRQVAVEKKCRFVQTTAHRSILGTLATKGIRAKSAPAKSPPPRDSATKIPASIHSSLHTA